MIHIRLEADQACRCKDDPPKIGHGDCRSGCLVTCSTVMEQIGTGISVLFLVVPERMSDAVKIILFALIFIIQKMKSKYSKTAPAVKAVSPGASEM